MLGSNVFGETTFRTLTRGKSRWGTLCGVFVTAMCCLGLTQTGPCPFGSPCRNFDANDDDACTVDTCEVVDGAATAVHTPVACPDQVCNPADGECVDCFTDADCDTAAGEICNTSNECETPDDTSTLAVFVDPDSDFSTRDVRDVDDEIVRFDTSTNSIIWAADGTSFQEGLWTVDGVLLAGGGFQVRFGTKDGERRAYFTETGPATICQIEVFGASLSISATSVTVPQE